MCETHAHDTCSKFTAKNLSATLPGSRPALPGLCSSWTFHDSTGRGHSTLLGASASSDSALAALSCEQHFSSNKCTL